MYRVKRKINTLIFLITLILLATGCSNQIHEDNPTNSSLKPKLAAILSYGEVEQLLNREFQPTKTEADSGTYQISNTKPMLYYLNDADSILVYEFSSIAERIRNVPGSYMGNLHTAYNYPLNDAYTYWTFSIRNCLLVYRVDNTTLQNLTFQNNLGKIKQIALSLNNGKEVIFKGASKRWEATVVTKYYQNWYQKKEGKILSDQNSTQEVKIKYCGAISEKPQSIKYEYRYPGGMRRGTLHTRLEKKDGWISLGVMESNFIPDSSSVCSFNLMWDNNREVINMTLK